MKHSTIIDATVAFVKEVLKNAEGGHDWFHIERVFKNTLLIAKEEHVNILVVSLRHFYMTLQIQNFIMEMKPLALKKPASFSSVKR